MKYSFIIISVCYPSWESSSAAIRSVTIQRTINIRSRPDYHSPFRLSPERQPLFLTPDYNSLPGRGKAAKARELVAEMSRKGRIPELASECAKMRPNLDWSDQTAEITAEEAAPSTNSAT